MFNLLDVIGWTLVDFVWQGAVIAAIAATVRLAVPRATPYFRYSLYCASLLACLLWPAANFLGRMMYDPGPTIWVVRAADPLVLNLFNGPVQASLEQHLHWIVIAWSACALTLGLRLSLGMLWLQRVATAMQTEAGRMWDRRAQTLANEFGIARRVVVQVIDNIPAPFTCGWLRPVVFLPQTLVSNMRIDLLEALLAHELAHILRHDYLVNLIQSVVEALLFYHPAVWWLSRRIRIERELIADDIAANKLGEPRRLAKALSELEKIQFSQPLALSAHGGNLMERITRLLRPATASQSWTAAIPVLALSAACLGLAGSAVAAPADDAEDQITKPVVDFRSCSKPVWPEEDLKAKREGTVTLEFIVSQQGKVMGARVLKSSGLRSLDKAALTGISKCSFKPATLNGEAIQSSAHMQYVWTHS